MTETKDMPDSPNQPPPRVWINPRPPRTLEDQLHDGGIWHYDGAPDDIPYVPEAHAAALQAQLDAAVKMNRELKIIVDIGTDDDPGTALSKLHKIQRQAVEQFRRRAVEAMRARLDKRAAEITCAWIQETMFAKCKEDEAVIELLSSLPATTEEGV